MVKPMTEETKKQMYNEPKYIKNAIKTCLSDKQGLPCMFCPYQDYDACLKTLLSDAGVYIQSLENQVCELTKQLDAEQSGWVSINNPPKESGRYLILFEDGHCCDAEYDECIDSGSKFGEGEGLYDSQSLGFLDSVWRGYQEVTHWMHIPHLPDKA